MPRELVRAAALYAGVPYSYAAIASAGTIFTAGACPLDQQGRLVAPDDIGGQIRHTLSNLFAALDAAGCGPEDVLKTTVYVVATNRAQLMTAWQAVEDVFGTDGPPSTLLGVSVLGWPGQLVEIEAVAEHRYLGETT